jgi:hypothetical protein
LLLRASSSSARASSSGERDGAGWASRSRCRRALHLAHEVVVEDEFVAVGDQQVGGRLLDADADHVLGVLAQLGHQRRKVRIAADDHEGIDVRLGVAQVERIDDHADVGRVLARLAHVRDLDQLEVGLVHRRLEALVAIPVAIGLLDDDAALEQQAFEHRLDVELVVLRIAHAERDVLEVAEQRHAGADVKPSPPSMPLRVTFQTRAHALRIWPMLDSLEPFQEEA